MDMPNINLAEIIKKNSDYNWKKMTLLATKIAFSLLKSHENSVIYGNLTPQNIIFKRDGSILFEDSKLKNSKSNIPFEIDSENSVAYLSPEQIEGHTFDQRSDIYSFGVMLYQMVTQKLPFDGKNVISIAIKHIQHELVEPKIINPEIPEALNEIILNCLAKDKSRRYQNMSFLIDDLKSLIVPSSSNKNYQGDDMNNSNLEEEYSSEEEKSVSGFEKRFVIFLGVICSFFFIGFVAAKVLPSTGINFKKLHFASSEAEIPNLIGKKYADIIGKYSTSNFKITKIAAVKSNEPEDTIIYQNPEMGKRVKTKNQTEICVKVSLGKKEIMLEDYARYKDFREAISELESLGFKVNIIKENNSKIPINSIIKQFPLKNTKLNHGDEVTLYVSTGPVFKREIIESPEQSLEPNDKLEIETEEKVADNKANDSNSKVKEIDSKEQVENTSQKPSEEVSRESVASTSSMNRKNLDKIKTIKDKIGILKISTPNHKNTRVTLKIGGKIIYNEIKSPNEVFDVKITGINEKTFVEIYFDDILMEKRIIDLN